jgi:hypothetical protein
VAGRGHWEALGPLGPPSVGAITRDEQWTVCRDMIRGGSNGLRAHFTRATCPTHHHIEISTCRPQREQTSRSRQSSTGVSAPYRAAISAGIGLDLVAAITAPDDEPRMSSGYCRVSTAGLCSGSPAPRPARRRIPLRRRQRLAGRLRSELRQDGPQSADARGERVTVVLDDAVQLLGESDALFVCQVKVHDLDMGSRFTAAKLPERCKISTVRSPDRRG